MKPSEFFQRLWRKSELRIPSPTDLLRKWSWLLRGAKIGAGTRLPPGHATWPHQVQIGAHCVLQDRIFYNYDHFWTPGPSIVIGDRVFIGEGVEFNCRQRIEIGDDALIGAGCKFVDHDHGTKLGQPINTQPSFSQPIILGNGVWLGANVVTLKGVSIGDGSMIGAGSVVTKSVPAFQVWAGVPAKFLHSRGPH